MSNSFCRQTSQFAIVFSIFHLTTYSKSGTPVLMPALQSHTNLKLSRRRNRKITTSTLEVWQHSSWTPEHWYIRGPVHFRDVKSSNISNTLWCSEAILGHIWPQIYHTHILLMRDVRGHRNVIKHLVLCLFTLSIILLFFHISFKTFNFFFLAHFLSAVANS